MRKISLTDKALCTAVSEMEAGLFDADLGSNILKKRIALLGRGKSGSTRTLIATNSKNRWFFVYGFEKSDRSNINKKELEALQSIAIDLLKLNSSQLDNHVSSGALQEICHDK